MWTDPHNPALLARLQQGVPLRRDAPAIIAGEIGLSVESVVSRLRRWQSEGVLREISALFDAAAMGYRTALIAQQLTPARLDIAAEAAASHPGVSHCYIRRGRYNLWFTLAVSPDSSLGLEGTAQRLAARAGDAPTLVLPALKRYKLRFRLPVAGNGPAGATPPSQPTPSADEPQPRVPSQEERAMIRLLQQPLPLRRHPFDALAEDAGIEVGELLAAARRLVEIGWLRRISASVRHVRAGAAVNVLAAWEVQDERIDQLGASASSESAVSHCYHRPASADWPYTLYTMVHGANHQEVRAVLGRIRRQPGVLDGVELPTLREVKKQRIRWFTDAEARWENDVGRG
ncbi:MAG: hypothetical protein ACOCWV_05970 [Planctomycetota bacterium]